MIIAFPKKKTPPAVTSSGRAETVCVPKPTKLSDALVIPFPRDRHNTIKVIACQELTA